MHLIATTDESRRHVDREQLERARKAGGSALIQTRPYTGTDSVGDGTR
jgi:hypothetical protein